MPSDILGMKDNPQEGRSVEHLPGQTLQHTLANLIAQMNDVQQQLDQRCAKIAQLERKMTSLPFQQPAAESIQHQLADVRQQAQMLEQQVLRLKAGIAAASDRVTSIEQRDPNGADFAIPGKTTETSGRKPILDSLAVGDNTRVQNTSSGHLRLHQWPGCDAPLLKGTASSTQFTLLEGPLSADDHTWWRIRTSDGREGWIAGEELMAHPD